MQAMPRGVKRSGSGAKKVGDDVVQALPQPFNFLLHDMSGEMPTALYRSDVALSDDLNTEP